MRFFLLFFRFVVIPAGALLMAAAGMSPEDAATNLEAWANYFGLNKVPDFLTAQSSDTWAMTIGLLLVTTGILSFFINKKPRKHAVRNHQEITKSGSVNKSEGAKQNEREQTPFAAWRAYIDQSISEAQEMLKRQDLTKDDIAGWRDWTANALRISIGETDSRNFAHSYDLRTLGMYSTTSDTPQRALGEFLRSLEWIRDHTTSDSFISTFDPRDLAFYAHDGAAEPRNEPDLSRFDSVDDFTLREAAFLWDDAEPNPGLVPGTQVYDRLQMLKKAIREANLVLENAGFEEEFAIFAGDEERINEIVNSNTRVSRDALRLYAENSDQRPSFLFPEDRNP